MEIDVELSIKYVQMKWQKTMRMAKKTPMVEGSQWQAHIHQKEPAPASS
jgi:hypothetical protein